MKLLKIALLSILSLNAFSNTPMEEMPSAAISTPTAAPQIKPQDYLLFAGAKILYIISVQRSLKKYNTPTNQQIRHCLKLIPSYFIPKLFADHVSDSLQATSQPAVKNDYKPLLRKGLLLLAYTYVLGYSIYTLCTTSIRDQDGSLSYAHLYSHTRNGLILVYNTTLGALQYKTIQALENPQHHKVPAALKTTLGISNTLSMAVIAMHWLLTRKDHFTHGAMMFDLYAKTNYLNKTIAAAEHHIAAQQQK